MVISPFKTMPGPLKRETVKRVGITTAGGNEAVMTTRGIRRSSIHTESTGSEVLCAWGWTKGHLGVGSRLAAMPPTWVRVILKERLERQGLRTLERHSHATPAK